MTTTSSAPAVEPRLPAPANLSRPRWFPETPHEESVYGAWRAAAAANPGLPRFRDWYEARYADTPLGAPATREQGAA